MNELPENELKQVGPNTFRLTTRFERLLRTDEFNKEFLIESYNSGIEELQKVTVQLRELKKKLKDFNITPEEEREVQEFIALNNRAARYNDFVKLRDTLSGSEDMLRRLENQRRDIENVFPSIKRRKK